MQAFELGPHIVPELGVQIRQWLIKQQQFRIADKGAADRQSLLLAATELGLGTTITARLYQRRDDIAKLLGLPDRVEPLLCIPVGYPVDGARFGGSRRKPLSEVAFYDVWGRAEP